VETVHRHGINSRLRTPQKKKDVTSVTSTAGENSERRDLALLRCIDVGLLGDIATSMRFMHEEAKLRTTGVAHGQSKIILVQTTITEPRRRKGETNQTRYQQDHEATKPYGLQNQHGEHFMSFAIHTQKQQR
jgi:hypothetical protein